MSINDVGLAIICGLPPAIGDTNTAETGPYGNGPYSLDLLAGFAGFTVNEQDWIPQRAQVTPKRAGAGDIVGYSESPLTETINLAATAVDVLAVNTLISNLERMAGLVRDFWTGASIEPVYLKWKAKGSPGPQYALIHNINLADKTSAIVGSFSGAIVLTVEREPYWRALPPGANPKLWTFEAEGTLGSKTYTNMQLHNGSDHLVYETIQNRHEWDPTDYLTTLSKNYVDIPAEYVPGDAPALVCMDIKGEAEWLYFWMSTGKSSLNTRDSSPVEYGSTFLLNGGDSVATDFTKSTAVGYGHLSNASSVNRFILTTTTALARYIIWQSASAGGTYQFGVIDTTILNGKFNVLVRLRNTAASRTMRCSLFSTQGAGISVAEIASTAPVNVGITSGTNHWHTVSLGILDIPGQLIRSSSMGYGVDTPSDGENTIGIRLDIDAGTSTTIEILDLILVKIDEGAGMVSGSGDTDNHILVDGTGYISGAKDNTAVNFYAAPVSPYEILGDTRPSELMGNYIQLPPGRNCRLFFLCINSGEIYENNLSLNVRANIIPRWTGRRDV